MPLWQGLGQGGVLIGSELSVCLLCGSPAGPSPTVVGPLRGPPLWSSDDLQSYAPACLSLAHFDGGPLDWNSASTVKSTEGISEIWFCEPFPRWGFLRFRVRVRFTYG